MGFSQGWVCLFELRKHQVCSRLLNALQPAECFCYGHECETRAGEEKTQGVSERTGMKRCQGTLKKIILFSWGKKKKEKGNKPQSFFHTPILNQIQSWKADHCLERICSKWPCLRWREFKTANLFFINMGEKILPSTLDRYLIPTSTMPWKLIGK